MPQPNADAGFGFCSVAWAGRIATATNISAATATNRNHRIQHLLRVHSVLTTAWGGNIASNAASARSTYT
jgi:hypothetical protein